MRLPTGGSTATLGLFGSAVGLAEAMEFWNARRHRRMIQGSGSIKCRLMCVAKSVRSEPPKSRRSSMRVAPQVFPKQMVRDVPGLLFGA